MSLSKTRHNNYGDALAQPDIDQDELKRLRSEYISSLKSTEQQQQAIAIQQVDDPTGEWKRQQHGRVMALLFS